MGSMLLISIPYQAMLTFILYTEGIQVRYDLYISDCLNLKRTLLFLNFFGVKKLVSNTQIACSYQSNSIKSHR